MFRPYSVPIPDLGVCEKRTGCKITRHSCLTPLPETFPFCQSSQPASCLSEAMCLLSRVAWYFVLLIHFTESFEFEPFEGFHDAELLASSQTGPHTSQPSSSDSHFTEWHGLEDTTFLPWPPNFTDDHMTLAENSIDHHSYQPSTLNSGQDLSGLDSDFGSLEHLLNSFSSSDAHNVPMQVSSSGPGLQRATPPVEKSVFTIFLHILSCYSHAF